MDGARWSERGSTGLQVGGSVSRKDSFPRLEGLIRYACESMNVMAQQRYAQENMDAQAAVCDEITSKGIETNAAHFAVTMIVQRYINGPTLDNARRGLQLLDSCVKNCGDAVHLSISEKEFLNELVRRFGPAPPPKNIIQQDILRLIETWNRTIAQKSFIKDDLGYIRDMHRLLVNKGFVFPEPDPDDVNALNGLEVKGLQTEDALKERRNLALKAKLQAYLRRGGNRHLQEANKIIKILSDYDQSDKADIRQEAADRIRDVRERTKLLTERLKAVKTGEQFSTGDAFESLVDDLKSEQHKLHNTLQNDRESDDSMAVLLSVNEEINRVVEWYDALRTGDLEEAGRLAQGGAAKGGNLQASNTPENLNQSRGLSLIDFEDALTENDASQPMKTDLQDDLLGLSLMEDHTMSGRSTPARATSGMQIPPGFPQPQNKPTQGAVAPQSSKPKYDLLNITTQHHPLNATQSPSPASSSYPNSPGHAPKAKVQASERIDPFAAIASSARASPRPVSLVQTSKVQSQLQTASHLPDGNLLELGDKYPQSTKLEPANSLNTSGAPDDDWDFTGAPPPEEEDFVVFDEDLKIEFQVSRASDTSIAITVVFSNNTSYPISKLEFLTGMPKLYARKIDPISSSRIQPHQSHGAYQRFTVAGVSKGQAQQMPHIKWKLSRMIQDTLKQDQGEAQKLSIS